MKHRALLKPPAAWEAYEYYLRGAPTYDRLRDLLIEAREAAGLTQADVAKRLARPQSYVSKVEQGERRLDAVEFMQRTRPAWAH